MQDYSYPSIFLSYLMFFLFLAGGIFLRGGAAAMATGARIAKTSSTKC